MKPVRRRWLGMICATLAGAFLAIGWWPFSPAPRNRVTWLEGGRGLVFESPGIACSTGPLFGRDDPLPEEFTVELAVTPRGGARAASQYIASWHDGALPSAFALCQWKTELLLRIPDSGHSRGFREVAVQALQGPRRLVTLLCRRTETAVFVDGQVQRRFPRFVVPPTVWRGQLVLGDAAGGKQPWSGEIHGLALLRGTLSAEEVRQRHEEWRRAEEADLRDDPRLVALFLFAEGRGRLTRDLVRNQVGIELPERYRVVQKQAFALPLNRQEFWRAGRNDAVLNLLGFIPFGLLVAFWRPGGNGRWKLRAWVVAALAGFVLSATIELGQVWLPTRVSSATDLLLNTIGSALGGWLAQRLGRLPVWRRFAGGEG